MRPASLSVLAVLLLGCFVTAQSDQTQISDRVEVFGGYTYERPDFSLVNSNGGANGWNAAVNFKMRPWIGGGRRLLRSISPLHLPRTQWRKLGSGKR